MILSFVDTEMGPYTRRLASTGKTPNVHLALCPRFMRHSGHWRKRAPCL